MAKTVLSMSVSLDGYCAGPRDGRSNPFGDGGDRLHDWMRDAARAKEAAGEKDVLVHGEVTARLALAAGVLDELEISTVPVLFGDGHRLFEPRDGGQAELEIVRVLQGEGVTHVRYRVLGA